jgi:hypothetical protein
LVINQLNKDWDMTHEKMDSYCKEIHKLEGKFYGIEYIHIVWDKNQAADALSKLGSSQAKVPHGVFVKISSNQALRKKQPVWVKSLQTSRWSPLPPKKLYRP